MQLMVVVVLGTQYFAVDQSALVAREFDDVVLVNVVWPVLPGIYPYFVVIRASQQQFWSFSSCAGSSSTCCSHFLGIFQKVCLAVCNVIDAEAVLIQLRS